MKSKIFLFGATEKDTEKLDALNLAVSQSCNVESAGYVACFRFGLRCLQEFLGNGAITYEEMEQEHSERCKNFTVKFGPYEMATLEVVKSGLEALAGQDLSRCFVLRACLECAGIWLEKNLEKATKDSEHAMRVMYALAYCSQSGPGIGPTKLVSTSELFDNFTFPEHNANTK